MRGGAVIGLYGCLLRFNIVLKAFIFSVHCVILGRLFHKLLLCSKEHSL